LQVSGDGFEIPIAASRECKGVDRESIQSALAQPWSRKEIILNRQIPADKTPVGRDSVTLDVAHDIQVALLTGGADPQYAYGLATSLMSKGSTLEIVGSDELNCPEFHEQAAVTFLNLRGDQRPASLFTKVSRVAQYYVRLIRYAAVAKPRIFHILWNNKFQFFDRTLLMLYYKALLRKIVFTAHNVNAGIRDGDDSLLNRLTLQIQYRLADHIFVHTERMKRELIESFGADEWRVTVIPYGINNAVPITSVSVSDAKRRLGIREGEKTLLFFGWIAPYKGVEYLVAALRNLLARQENYRLVIAGGPKNCEEYWKGIREAISGEVDAGRILLRAEFIPDEETEVYFKAADVLVLPYRHIYQSGILFLGYSFGLPVLAADVGSLKDDIVEGKTGFIFRPEDSADLTKTLERYFASELYADLDNRRQQIRDYVTERHSWDIVGRVTMDVYAGLLRVPSPK
jgi:glycosyltransferase involved in cell wall biosynthesis